MNKSLFQIIKLFLLTCLFLGSTSCKDVIFDDLKPCEFDLFFVYDYNMKFADAFSAEVKSIDLFIFDAQGKYIKTVKIENENFPKNYHLKINDLIPGTYSFLTWAGLYERSFEYPKLVEGKTDINDVTIHLKNTGIIDKQFDNFWYGRLDGVKVSGNENNSETISLIKDSKKFKLSLLTQGLEDSKIDISDYDIEIVSENNGIYFSDNLIEKKGSISYKPYLSKNFKEENFQGVKYAGGSVEIQTGRIIDGNNNRLIIKDKSNGKVLLDENIEKLIDQIRFEEFKNMPIQEYLDRQDYYNITLIFSGNIDFVAFKIWINGWLVREQTAEI